MDPVVGGCGLPESVRCIRRCAAAPALMPPKTLRRLAGAAHQPPRIGGSEATLSRPPRSVAQSHRPYAACPLLHERPAAMLGDLQHAAGSAPAARAGRPARQPTAGAGRGQCARASQRGVHLCTGEGWQSPAGPHDTVQGRRLGAARQRRRRAPAPPPARPLLAQRACFATSCTVI